MPRVLEIKRDEAVMACKAVYKICLNGVDVGTIANGQIFRCTIPENVETALQIKEKFSLMGLGSGITDIERGTNGVSYTLSVGFTYMQGTDFKLTRRAYLAPVRVDFDKINVQSDGIHYLDSEKREHFVSFKKAHKFWNIQNNKKKKRFGGKIVCDIIEKQGAYEIVFHTDPQLIICADECQKNEFLQNVEHYKYKCNNILSK